jgi:DNA-binding CsgD family transcriptional regulator
MHNIFLLNVSLFDIIVVAIAIAFAPAAAIVLCFIHLHRMGREAENENARTIRIRLQMQKRKMLVEKMNDDIELRDEQLMTAKANLESIRQLQQYLKVGLDIGKRESLNQVRIKFIDFNKRIEESAMQRVGDWKNFEIFFDCLYPKFLQNFSTAFPELTKFELRLCALLKINLETKQIASIFNISNEGTKVAKYRLRKKLKLTAEENLIAFFNSI